LLNLDLVTFSLKLILVPTFIGAVSLAGRRWGPAISGWLIGLPLTSGPVAFFLALEQGNVFASEASRAIMMGIVSVFVFCVAYSWIAVHHMWLPSMLGGWVVYFASTALLEMVYLPLLVCFAFVLAVLLLSIVLMPKAASENVLIVSPRWDIPARMFSATALVILITGIANLLGPQLTGLLTPFPVYATILAVFTHRLGGRNQTVKLLRGVVAGSFTFAVFFLVISMTIIAWGLGVSFVCAIGVSLVSHTVSLLFLKHQKGLKSQF
jgi:hypothetical protein